MTPAAFRRLSLGFPAGFAMVSLTPDEQPFFVGAHPATFTPVKGRPPVMHG